MVEKALEMAPLDRPLVVRLAGTVEEGRAILAESGLPVISANTLAEAAQKAVGAARDHKTAA